MERNIEFIINEGKIAENKIITQYKALEILGCEKFSKAVLRCIEKGYSCATNGKMIEMTLK